VAAREIGQGQARRKKWLTGLVVAGFSAAAIAVVLTYWGGSNHHNGPVQIPPSPPPDVNQQLSGYTFTRSQQGRPVFTVHAARTVSYQESKSTTLEDVMVEIYGHKGDSGDILRTDRCEYNPQSGDFLAAGPVQIQIAAHSAETPGSGIRGKHRVVVDTSKVAYHHEDDLADTDEPVKFRMGSASGTANGMTYAIQDGWLELKRNVAVDLAQGTEKNPQPPMHLTAAALRYDKDGGSLALTGPVEVTQGKSRAIADSASVQLDDHNRLSRVILEGNAKAFDENPLRSMELDAHRVQGDFDAGSGELRHITAEKDVTGESKGKRSISHLTAHRVDLDLGGKHPQPLHGVAKGDVHINLESQPVITLAEKTVAAKAPEKKALAADEVRFGFWPGAHGLKDAETGGPGTLTISPSDPKTGERVINAGQFLMTFDPRSRIESLRGQAPTKVLFYPPKPTPIPAIIQQSQADLLNAIFDPGTQTLREVRQTGNFQYQDGDRQASADDAHFDAQAQTMVLLGHPQVWDPSSRVRSQKITLDMRNNTATGEGKVQSVQLQSPAPGSPPPRTPPLPTNVLADKMVARRQSKTIHYEGNVRAWNGTDVVESTALDVFRAEKRVSSGSQVVTSFLQPAPTSNQQGGTSHSTGGPRPVTVHADYLEYFDEGRRARYHGNVRMVTEGTTMESDRLDVYFTQGDTMSSSEVDRAEADGQVKVTQPGRIGTGNHAEYFAGPGKLILTGGPPLLVDEEKGSTTGQRLTFFIHDDRLFVDGGDQTPSLTTHRVAQ
jgi:lipopolysaccharide export system protein LptA